MWSTIIFACSAINVAVALQHPLENWFNWAAAVFCFGLGIANAIIASK